MGDDPEVDVSVHPDVFVDQAKFKRACAKKAGVSPKNVAALVVLRRSIDARRHKVQIRARVRVCRQVPDKPKALQPAALAPMQQDVEVLIVGAGPAGMFCAWQLAKQGIRARVLERGAAVRTRRRDLASLSQRGELNPESNYCFGEGGAGTYSDGKLYTRSSKRGPIREVLEALVGYGATPAILVDGRPHIGTNKLPRVIKAMREHLVDAGVEFAFNHRVDDLLIADGNVVGVRVGDEPMHAKAVVMAPGHSAHDVYRWLHARGVPLSFKPFAIGVRIEHPQRQIDELQFGALAGHPALGAASYRLVERAPSPHGDSVGIYSFCMCPGGYIVPAATSHGRQVVNGMSPSKRRGGYANSGFVTEVNLQALQNAGLDPADPLAGLAFQQAVEERAFRAGGGQFVAPAQTLADFVHGRQGDALPPTSYHRGLRRADLSQVLGDLAPPIRQALLQLEAKMPGFCSEDAVAVGVESRTSAPIRIERDRDGLASPRFPNLYPCAEGAGYAGGIVSAALDGIAVANAIASAFGSTPTSG